MIDLNKLRHAVTIAKEGSYSAAAEKLNLSQPALSRSIQSLEAAYGIRLFERGHGGARITIPGAKFLTIARNLLQRVQVSEEQLLETSAGRHRPVNVGIGPITSAMVLPNLLPSLIRDGFRLRVRVDTVSTLQLFLRQGEIDFYISGLPIGLDRTIGMSDFHIRRLPFSGLGLMVRKGHPLLSSQIDQQSLATYPVASGGFLHEVLSPSRLTRLGLSAPSIEMDDYATLAALARETDIMVLALPMVHRLRPEFGLESLPFTIPIDDMEWGLVSSKRDNLPKSVTRVASRMFERLSMAVSQCAPEGMAAVER